MKDMLGMMQQAKALQEKMATAQAEIEALTVDGSAGAGAVRLTLSGKGALLALVVDAALLRPDEKEIVEDLVIAAHADAKSRLDEALGERMRKVTGGLALPEGLKLF